MDLAEELETTAQEVLGKLRSGEPFQSNWDTAAFIIFLIFLGTVLLLMLLVCTHCCCHSSCSRRASRPQKVSPTGPRGWAGARGSLELPWGEEGVGPPVERGRQGTHE
uniref:Small integral membrane protein 22 isoform X1 n=1 Tax=Callorhinus ursinus TaxID=34884 RepID=A0A3Q7PG36_CALUR|nr:small integral membrane protein 22 isoform X1 [Callorhinus ursinus]